MRPPPITAAALRLSILVLATVDLAACDRYEPRCTVTDPVVELEAPARSILRLVEERDGGVLASWFEVEPRRREHEPRADPRRPRRRGASTWYRARPSPRPA